jgi:hypothetical protein
MTTSSYLYSEEDTLKLPKEVTFGDLPIGTEFLDLQGGFQYVKISKTQAQRNYPKLGRKVEYPPYYSFLKVVES